MSSPGLRNVPERLISRYLIFRRVDDQNVVEVVAKPSSKEVDFFLEGDRCVAPSG